MKGRYGRNGRPGSSALGCGLIAFRESSFSQVQSLHGLSFQELSFKRFSPRLRPARQDFAEAGLKLRHRTAHPGLARDCILVQDDIIILREREWKNDSTQVWRYFLGERGKKMRFVESGEGRTSQTRSRGTQRPSNPTSPRVRWAIPR